MWCHLHEREWEDRHTDHRLGRAAGVEFHFVYLRLGAYETSRGGSDQLLAIWVRSSEEPGRKIETKVIRDAKTSASSLAGDPLWVLCWLPWMLQRHTDSEREETKPPGTGMHPWPRGQAFLATISYRWDICAHVFTLLISPQNFNSCTLIHKKKGTTEWHSIQDLKYGFIQLNTRKRCICSEGPVLHQRACLLMKP